MPIPGDVPGQFRTGVQNDAAKLEQLAAQVRRSVQRAEPPLEIIDTPAGGSIRDNREPERLARLDAQDGSDNRWGWTEMLGRADGEVVEKPGGMVTAATQKYAVPVTGSGAALDIGIVRPKGDYYEFVPVGAAAALTVIEAACGTTINGAVSVINGDTGVVIPTGTYLVFAMHNLQTFADTIAFMALGLTGGAYSTSGTAIRVISSANAEAINLPSGTSHTGANSGTQVLQVTSPGTLVATGSVLPTGSASGGGHSYFTLLKVG